MHLQLTQLICQAFLVWSVTEKVILYAAGMYLRQDPQKKTSGNMHFESTQALKQLAGMLHLKLPAA